MAVVVSNSPANWKYLKYCIFAYVFLYFPLQGGESCDLLHLFYTYIWTERVRKLFVISFILNEFSWNPGRFGQFSVQPGRFGPV